MPEFLCEIDVSALAELPAGERSAILAAERRRGLELLRTGAIAHIWRLPGRQANVSIWQAPDATELHALLSSLPVWPYARVTVTALATHPLLTPETSS
jgi:muconolactone D-isomerase